MQLISMEIYWVLNLEEKLGYTAAYTHFRSPSEHRIEGQ